MPELLEISGLDDDLGQEEKKPEIIGNGKPLIGPDFSDSIFFGLAAVAVAYAIGAAFNLLSGKTLAAGGTAVQLGDLGVIRRCRPSDLTSKKPKSQQKWCLWTQAETRILGRHATREKALRQERLIQMKKHRG